MHLILDNYGTHGHEKVKQWLSQNPRFVLHFIPTSSSWLNLVERWFAELTEKAIRRSAFRSVEDLKKAIAKFSDFLERQSFAFRLDGHGGKDLGKNLQSSKSFGANQPWLHSAPSKIITALNCGTLAVRSGNQKDFRTVGYLIRETSRGKILETSLVHLEKTLLSSR